jgi:hypothetical protein
MIPGLSGDAESRLLAVLDSRVTDVHEDRLSECDFIMLAADEPSARQLGVECCDAPAPTLVVTDGSRPIGSVRVQSQGQNNLLFFDNRRAEGRLHANIRLLGSESVLLFYDIGNGYVALPDVLLRSNDQFLFWGTQAMAVGCSVEIEGNGRGVVIGDDALISSGVWIRNHDMHAIHRSAHGGGDQPGGGQQDTGTTCLARSGRPAAELREGWRWLDRRRPRVAQAKHATLHRCRRHSGKSHP